MNAILTWIGNFSIVIVAIIALMTLWKGIKLVPQSKIYIVERFGRFHKAMQPGLNIIIPFFDSVAHRVSILEQQLDDFPISVITKDNVEIELVASVFYRIHNPAESVYRIANLKRAIYTGTASIVRSAAGKQELDEIQSSREEMNQQIEAYLKDASKAWGTEITRTEIVDVRVDEKTKASQRKQLDADRDRRATVAEAEGRKQAVQLEADAKLYDAQRSAEAVRVTADADAYAVKVKAEADAEQTKLVGTAIRDYGQPAVDFEIRKRQVNAIADLAQSESTRTMIMPTDVTAVLGSLATLVDLLPGRGDSQALLSSRPTSGARPADGGEPDSGAWE